MGTFLENIELTDMLIVVGGLLIIVLLLMLHKRNEKKMLMSELQECETEYNSLKSIPISFKFNKTVALSKLDESAMEEIVEYQGLYDRVQANLKQAAVVLANTEDKIHLGKLKRVDEELEDLDNILKLAREQATKLNAYLDKVLEKEIKQRSEVTLYKDQFRTVKALFKEKESQYSFCWDKIVNLLNSCEKRFTSFEEWMYASEFENATNELDLIHEDLLVLETLEKEVISLIQITKGVIPNIIEEVSKNYFNEKRKGMYLDHLEIPRNLEMLQDVLKEDLNNIRNCNIEHIFEHCEDYKVRLGQLQSQLDHEVNAYGELDEMVGYSKKIEVVFDGLVHYFNELNINSLTHYGVDNLSETVENATMEINNLKEIKNNEFIKLKEGQVPASEILITLKEVQQKEDKVLSSLVSIKDRIDTSHKEEYRAFDQLMKLELVTNEIKIKVKKNRLPSISKQFHVDLEKAYDYTRGIKKLLKETPLNTDLLSSYSSEALEFISKLHADVNNIIGVAKWVEDTIVFGNKFRSSYPDIDSELSKAELLYRNGEYSEALKIAIAAVELLYPTSFEKKIKENAQSVN